MTENEQIEKLRADIHEVNEEYRAYCKERKCSECDLFFMRLDCQNHFIAKGLTAKGYRKVERGEWIPVISYLNGWRCSLCRNEVYTHRKSEIDRYKSPFCPYCGADMRGEEE